MSDFKDNAPVPVGWAGQDKRFAYSLKENVDVLTGNRGDPLDRAVTVRDLLDAGIIKLARGSNLFGNNGFEIDPTILFPTLAVPPAPTNLEADGAFQNILLDWDLQFYIGHAGVEIWRHTSNSLAGATLVGTMTGMAGVYVDAVGSDKSFYYWVRAINQNGVYGPYNSSSGTLGATAIDVAYMLELLGGAITASELATSLSEQLETYQTLTDVNGNITARGYQTLANINSLGFQTLNDVSTTVATAVTAVRGKIPTWSANGAYAVDEVVRDSAGKLYVCLIAVTASTSDTLPTTFAAPTTNWKLHGDIARTEDSASAITQLNLLTSTSTSAAAQAIHGIKSVLFDNNGDAVVSATNLSTMKTSLLNENGVARATASQIDYLSSSYTNPDTGVANNVTLQEAMNTSASNVNGLNAQYSVKIDNNGHVSGFGLSSTATDAGPSSAFIVRADKFAVIDPASTDDALGTTSPTAANIPFFIQGGTTYIKAAAILDASITTVKIQDAAIDNAKIADISAGKINTGTLDASLVTISGVSPSLNIESASSGARMQIQGSRIRVFDSNGQPRVKLGNLA